MRELARKPDPEEQGKGFSEYILILVLVAMIAITAIIG